MAKPVNLTPAQENQILDAASALDPAARKLLRERVLDALGSASEIGDGLVHRVCARAQRELWTPPDDTAYLHRPRFQKLG